MFLRFMYDMPDGWVIVDYHKVIDEGIKGLLKRIDERINALGGLSTKEKFDKYNFYKRVRLALEGVVNFA
ncbi:MAG: pyruvate formate lyase family protein [Desulfomonilia bacterium]